MARVTWVPMNDLSRALAAEQSDLAGVFADVLRSGWLVQGPQHDAFETGRLTRGGRPLEDLLGRNHPLPRRGRCRQAVQEPQREFRT